MKKKKIGNEYKESQQARYERVSSGISLRATTFRDRKKQSKKMSCRNKGGNRYE